MTHLEEAGVCFECKGTIPENMAVKLSTDTEGRAVIKHWPNCEAWAANARGGR